MNTSENPAELFGLRLAHVGINTNTPEEAASTADALCALLGIKRGEEPFRPSRCPRSLAASLRS